jgi:hypothetical protein
LSRGSGPASYPAKPLVSFRTYRQLSGWNPPPLMIRAFRAHCHCATLTRSKISLRHLGSRKAEGSTPLRDVLHIMERIAQAGAGFRSITESIDTTTPAGRMMMQMVGSFAEFERAMIRERTSAGLATARAEGRVGGRRKKLDAAKCREIAESVITGRKSGAEMARLYNISQPTVSRIVAQHRMSSP